MSMSGHRDSPVDPVRLLWHGADSPEEARGGERILDLRRKTVMGVINRTPDSFFPASRYASAGEACRQALTMASRGAAIVDIGGESTRPGSEPVDAGDECRRVIPVIERLRAASGVAISIDTRKPAVAERALDAGADLVNDVSALADPAMRALAAERGVPVVLMHMRGTPRTMQRAPHYHAVVEEVIAELRRAIDRALAAGVRERQIIVDPGIGFGKRVEDNLTILREVGAFRRLGRPVLLGLSHKSFLGKVLGDRPVDGRQAVTIAAGCLALAAGADIIRVHDVTAAADTVRLLEAVRRGTIR